MSERLRARRARVRTIRRRVVGLATATFLATTGGIVVQLVTGNDPALASKAKPAGTSAATSAASTSSLSALTTSSS